MAQPPSASQLKARGDEAFRARGFDAADAAYSEALRGVVGDDGLATLHLNRAAARLQLQDFLGALEDADATLALDSRRAKGWYRKAAALRGLGRWAAAAAAAQQCLSLTAGVAQQEAQQLLGALQAEQAQHSARGRGEHSGLLGQVSRAPISRACIPSPFRQGPWEFIPPCDGLSENLLLLLHGLGDTPAAFARLARQMRLPQTACLALAGALDVPFTEGGRSWFQVFDDDMELIQARPGEARRLRSLDSTLDSLQRLLRALSQHCGWAPGRVHLLGFSQGGTTALELALRCASGPSGGLGSCVAISAALLEERLEQQTAKKRQAGQQGHQEQHGKPPEAAGGGSGSRGGSLGGNSSDSMAGGDSKSANDSKDQGQNNTAAGAPPPSLGPQAPRPVPQKGTPVLLTHGTADRVVARGLVERSVQFMRSVHGMGGDVMLKSVPGKGHGMVQGADEMKGLMEFWSRVLSRRPTGQDGVPGGADGELLEMRPGELSIEQVAEGSI